MQYLSQLFEFIQKLFVWWVIISPWEQGLRVRGGKKVAILEEGVHLRIPFWDQTFVQATRLRVVSLPPTTVSTKDGKTLTIILAIGYSIDSIETLYRKMSSPESTICNLVQGEISEYVSTHTQEENTPSLIESHAFAQLKAMDYGISFEYLKVTGYAIVKTYRLIQDSHWIPNDLKTDEPKK